MCLKCAHHSVWGQIVFKFIYYNSFPTSPLSVAKESTAVEKCVRQPWSWREGPHNSTVISLFIHLIVDVKKCVHHFFVRTHPLYMRPLRPRWICVQHPLQEFSQSCLTHDVVVFFMFMHLADTFIQSDLHWLVGRVRKSCLRTPTGGSTFHAQDLNPGQPHERWQSYRYTLLSMYIIWFNDEVHGTRLNVVRSVSSQRDLC